MFSLMRRRPARSERGLTRWNADPFSALREEMDSLLDRFMEGWRFPPEWVEARDWQTEETEREVIMRLELPGFDAREIDIRREGDTLVVCAAHPEVKEEKEKVERMHAERFEYRMTFPFGTDADKIEALYRNGILELRFPRLPEAQPKRIEVKT